MNRILVICFALLIMGCFGSTDPSYDSYSKITAIDAEYGTIESELDLNDSGIYQICLSPDGQYLYAMQYWGADVIQINCASLAVTNSLEIEEYGLILSICLNDLGDQLCVNIDNDLFFIDTPSMTLTDSLKSISQLISNITFRPDTDLVYASYLQYGGQHDGGFVVIDASECAIVNTLELGIGVSEPVFSSSGNDLYVLLGNSILRLDPDTGTQLASRNFDEQLAGLTIDRSTNTLYVSCMKNDAFAGGVLAVEGSNLTIQDSLEYGEALGQLCHVPSLEYLYANLRVSDSQQLLIINELNMEILGTVQLSRDLMDMVSDPYGERLYCSISYQID